ncbi:MAG: YihY family inner membrane protein [Gammaproteobacteria bacterium]|nr:YihY family inner membrane protein [Gammaproteobacteria bacterium]
MSGALLSFFLHCTDRLWNKDLGEYGTLKRKWMRFARILYVAMRDLQSGSLTLRAMGLVYTTLLSLVPMLAVSFSLLKAFGVQYQIEPLLSEMLSPLGSNGPDIVNAIISFVNRIDVGVLGAIGFVFLFYTVVSLISKIEEAFNYIWQIHTQRNVLQRFSYYLSVILIGPVLIFTALGFMASMMSTTFVQRLSEMEPFGSLFFVTGYLASYVLVIIAFVFIYIFLPNTPVKFRPALTGAFIAGIMWKTAGWVFATFIATTTKYHAIYSGLAVLILFMVWIYVSWLILLFGAKITYYIQNPEVIRRYRLSGYLSNNTKEQLVLATMYYIGEHYLTGQKSLTIDELSHLTKTPTEWIEKIITTLKKNSLILETDSSPRSYVPARDLDTISLYQILEAARVSFNRRGEEQTINIDCEKAIEVSQSLDHHLRRQYEKLSLKEWIKEED